MSKSSSKRLVVAAVPFIVMVFGAACEDLPDEELPIVQYDAGAASTDPDPVGAQDARVADARVTPNDPKPVDSGIGHTDASHVATDAGVTTTDAGDDPAPVDSGLPNEPVDAGAPLTAFGKVYALVTESCVSCHGAGKTLDMSTPALTHQQLVGVEARYKACAGADGGLPKMRVMPGSPEGSLLIEKLEGVQSCGKQMPIMALLPAESVDVFRAWIAAGAPAD